MKRNALVALAVVVLVIAAFVLWRALREPAPVQVEAPTPSPVTVAPPPVAVAPPAEAASPAAPRHPLPAEPAASAVEAPPPDLATALADLFGRRTVLALFLTEEFAHRVVATVDNLGGPVATPRLWPLNPAGGRFTVARRDGAEVIAADNAKRYAAHVALLEKADLRGVVALYRRFYPQFQRAYEELGYPKRYFNDRLVEVLDLLIATPDVSDPLKVRLPAIQGPYQPERPWLLYEFDDPRWQSLAAGQRILLRMGAENRRRVKARLAELRALVA